MIIHVHPADGETRSIGISGKGELSLPKEFELIGQGKFSGEYTCLGDDLFLIEGDLSFAATALCARCVRPVSIEMNIAFKERFARESMSGEDEELYLFTGDEIDLSQALQEAATVALPMRVLCREDCKGLCPVCGADRNENECVCETVANNAFSILKQLDLHKEV